MKVRITMPVVAIAAAAALAGGGVAVAATTPFADDSRPSMSGMGNGGSMMDGAMPMGGGGSTMGQFSQDLPFDLQFIDQMTMHHQGALMSTRAMIADSGRPELRDLAAAIEKSQTAQVRQMQQWRAQWYGRAPSTLDGDMDGGMMQDAMGSDMAASMRTGMAQMMGGAANVETMYLQMMIVHHQLGVDMAKEAIARSDRPEVRQLAQQIVDEQSAQIVLMRGYLAGK